MSCTGDRLGGGGDGVEFARGFPQGDVGFEFAHHFFEAGEVERLGAVADGFFGVRVDFDDDAVGADGHARARDGGDEAALSGGVAGVEHDREDA